MANFAIPCALLRARGQVPMPRGRGKGGGGKAMDRHQPRHRGRVPILEACLACVALVTSVLVGEVATPAAATTTSVTSALSAGQTLSSGQSLWSTDGAYQAAMQTDGNFVVYASGGRPIFNTGTGGVGTARLAMQSDGNLVVYAADGRAVWNSSTSAGMSSVAMQTDGNLVVYAPGNVPLWTSNRARGAITDRNKFYGGQCTWGAAYKWHEASGTYPGFTGDAYQWTTNAQTAGYSIAVLPQARAVVVFPSSSDSPVGHVGWVDFVQQRSDGLYIGITEMNRNWDGKWGTRVLKHSAELRYILVPYGP